MLNLKFGSLVSPLIIEVFQRNLVCSLQISWSARTPKRIEIRRLRNEIFALAEIAKLWLLVVVVVVLGTRLYNALYGPNYLSYRVGYSFISKMNIQGVCLCINHGNRTSSPSYTGVWKPRYNARYRLNHFSNSNINSTRESTTKQIEARAGWKTPST